MVALYHLFWMLCTLNPLHHSKTILTENNPYIYGSVTFPVNAVRAQPRACDLLLICHASYIYNRACDSFQLSILIATLSFFYVFKAIVSDAK